MLFGFGSELRLSHLVLPIVLAVVEIKDAALDPPELEREARAELLHVDLLLALKDVSVLAEKDVIALIVDRHHSAALKLGLVGEERPDHPRDGASETCRKVVDDQLGVMICHRPFL